MSRNAAQTNVFFATVVTMSHKSLGLAKTILSRALGSNPVWRFGYEFGNFQSLGVRSYQCYLQNDKAVMEILLPRPYRESCLTNHMHMDNVSRQKGPFQLLHPTAVSVGPALSRLTARVSPLSVQRREHMLPSKKGQLITGVAKFCAFFFFFFPNIELPGEISSFLGILMLQSIQTHQLIF